MYYINVWLTVKDKADVPRVRELLTESSRLSREEPGCHRFEVYHSQSDETRFLLCEHWTDQAALEAHRTRRAVTEIYIPKVLPLVVREPHVSTMLP